MNANRARPMVAFWLLALLATVIVLMGLHERAGQVAVPGGSPSPVIRSGSPDLLLGGLLRAEPSATPASSRADTTSALTTGGYPGAGTPAGSASGPTARVTVSGPKVGVPTDTSVVARARASTTATATATATGPGTGTHGAQGSGATSTATATAAPTDHGQGRGNGSSASPSPGQGGGNGGGGH